MLVANFTMKINKRDSKQIKPIQDEIGVTDLRRIVEKGNSMLAIDLQGLSEYKPDNDTAVIKTTGSNLPAYGNTLIFCNLSKERLTGLWNISNDIRQKASRKDLRFKNGFLAEVTVFPKSGKISVKPANIKWSDMNPSQTLKNLEKYDKSKNSTSS